MKEQNTFKFTIRFAQSEDAKHILKLIKELAIYERCSDALILTEDRLIKDGFGDNPLFHCLIAESSDDILGIAIYYRRYSSWKGQTIHLEDLIVKDEYRKKGVGEKLFIETAKEAKKCNAERFEWEVLEWNHSAINFYKKMGANIDTEWFLCKMNKKELDNLLNKRSI